MTLLRNGDELLSGAKSATRPMRRGQGDGRRIPQRCPRQIPSVIGAASARFAAFVSPLRIESRQKVEPDRTAHSDIQVFERQRALVSGRAVKP